MKIRKTYAHVLNPKFVRWSVVCPHPLTVVHRASPLRPPPQRHAGPVGSVRFNPRYLMAASCCYNLVYWAHPNMTAA